MNKAAILVFLLMFVHTTVFASTPSECIKKADGARAEMLLYKEGKSSEEAVRQSAVDASTCIAQVDAKGKSQHKNEAIAAWKAFCAMREEKILPTVVFYNKLTRDNKANLDKTKDALRAIGNDEHVNECIKKADTARAALLLYKDGKGDEPTVNQTALDTTRCIDQLDAKEKTQSKNEAVAAWKTFRSIREGKIIPAVKSFMKNSGENTANLNKTKDALRAIEAGN